MARRPCSTTSITAGKRDRGYWDALEIGGEVIEVDTTGVAGVDYDAICERIRAAL
tara:strand:+ start:109 stop:273 length:165 start_codon:yes stop_codon:yes gene_type:complete